MSEVCSIVMIVAEDFSSYFVFTRVVIVEMYGLYSNGELVGL